MHNKMIASFWHCAVLHVEYVQTIFSSAIPSTRNRNIEIFLRNSPFSGKASGTSDQQTSNNVPLAALCEELWVVQN